MSAPSRTSEWSARGQGEGPDLAFMAQRGYAWRLRINSGFRGHVFRAVQRSDPTTPTPGGSGGPQNCPPPAALQWVDKGPSN